MSPVQERAAIMARAPIMTPTGPIPSPYTGYLLAPIITFVVLATIAVGVRLWAARRNAPTNWKTMDLWLVIAALIVTWGCIISEIIGAALVGLDYIDDRLGLEGAAELSFKIYFADVITQTTASGLVKLSVLEFYKRIFVTRGFKIVCNVVEFLIAVWIIGTFFTQLFSTSPISSAWHPALQLIDANYDYPTAMLAIFGIGMVLDVLVLSLPLRPIYKLQMDWRRKIKIYLILWLGMFCVICASVRFWYTYRQLNVVFEATAEEKASITIEACLWSMLEPSAAIIAACLPTYGILVKGHSFGSMVKSARSFFSISSRSRSRSSLTPSKDDHSSSDQDTLVDGWRGRSSINTYKADIEANLTQVPPARHTDNRIHATTEVTVARHGEPHEISEK